MSVIVGPLPHTSQRLQPPRRSPSLQQTLLLSQQGFSNLYPPLPSPSEACTRHLNNLRSNGRNQRHARGTQSLLCPSEMIRIPSGASTRGISSGLITPGAHPQFSGAPEVLAYFQPSQWAVRVEGWRQQIHLKENADSESVRIRGGGVLSRVASVFVCESCEWDGRSRSGEILHAGWIDGGIEMGFGVEKRRGASRPPGRTRREDRHSVKLACKWDTSMWQRWLICIHMQPRWGDREPPEGGLVKDVGCW